MRNKYLHSAAYRLGERRVRISDMERYEVLLRKLKIPMSTEIGLTHYCATSNIYRLVEDSIAETIDRSGVAATDIDHVVVCSSHFADAFLHRNRGLASALTNNGVFPKKVRGVSGTGCADVLCGIEMAAEMLSATAENVLLIGLEAFPGESPSRLLDFAVISDAVVSLIVSNSPGNSALSGTYKIQVSESVSFVPKIGSDMTVSDAKTYGATLTSALAAAQWPLTTLTKVFASNTFRLVKKARETAIGFSEAQMYLSNVERIGHCLACDAIVNLIDYGGSNDPAHYALYAEAEGHAAAILLTGVADYA